MPDHEVVVEAEFEDIPEDELYIIHFDPNGGDGEKESWTGEIDDLVNPPAYTRRGYRLLGFSPRPDAVTPDYTEPFLLDEEAAEHIMGDGKEGTLYAVWRRIDNEEPDNPPPYIPPRNPSNPGPGSTSTGSLITGDNNTYIELDVNGTPTGEWRSDPEIEEWIFDPFVPLAELPQTGDGGMAILWLILMIVSAVGMARTLIYRKKRHSA